MTESKLDEILSSLKQMTHKVEALETRLNSHGDTLARLTSAAKTTSMAVDEACGVDPAKIRSNQLLGENSRVDSKTPPSNEELQKRAARKKKQALGARLYAIYCWVFVALMAAACLGYLPVFEIEKSLSLAKAYESSRVLKRTLHVPVIFSGIYVFVIFGIQKFMENKEPFDLRNPLALWSLFLGLFSLFGALRVVPTLFKMIASRPLSEVICGDTRFDWVVHEPAGLWTFLFVLSKVPELIDTLFIVLRKRPLITLHWYHHITVMLYCWHSWSTQCLYGVFFAAMNLTVHAFMYIFYFLAALGYRPTAFAQSVTVIQIAQMFVGTSITFYTVVHMTFIQPIDIFENFSLSSQAFFEDIDYNATFDGTPTCKVNPVNALAGISMYSSYLWLFCVFFYYAYIQQPRRPGTKPADDAKEKAE